MSLIECFLHTKPCVESDTILYRIYSQTTEVLWMELVIEQRCVIIRLSTAWGPNPGLAFGWHPIKCRVKWESNKL